MLEDCIESNIDENDTASKWIIRLEMDKESILDKNITMDDVNFAIKNSYKDEMSCVYSDYNDNNLVIRLRLNNLLQNKKRNKKV